MAKKDIYTLDVVIGVKGDNEAKSKLRATEKFLQQTEKRMKKIEKATITPAIKINDRASSTIDKIESKTNRLKRATTGTLRMTDQASSVLDRVSAKRKTVEKNTNPTVSIKDQASDKINQIEARTNKLKKATQIIITAKDSASSIIERIKSKSKILSRISDMVISAKDKTAPVVNKIKAKVQNLVAASVISLNMKADPAIRAITLARNKLSGLSEKINEIVKNKIRIPVDLIDKASDKLEDIGNKIGSLAELAVKGFATIATGVGVATTAVLAGVMKMVDAASNLNESINVVSTTFAESGDQMVAWARTAGSEFGMGTQQVMEFTGQMGAMLKSSGIAGEELNTMTKELVALTGDMSSFYNLPHDEVWEKLRSGMMGETEPLKALGINMSVANMEAFSLSKGINKSWKEMSQAEQVALRYQYIMQQTADTHGDFAKTAQTLPNQLRSLKNNFIDIATAIGQVFLPVVENGLLDATKKFRTNFKDIIESLNDGDLVGAMDKIGQAFGEGLLRLGDVANKMIPMVNRAIVSLFKSVAKSAYNYFPTFLQGFNKMLIQVSNRITREGPAIAKAFGQTLEMAFGTLQSFIPSLLNIGLQLIISLCQGMINSGPQLIAALSQTISLMASSISANMPLLIALALQLINMICIGLQQNMPLIVQAAYDLILGLANGISQNMPLLINTVSQIINLICTTIIILLPQIIDLGFQIINSLAVGLTSNSDLLMSSLMNLGSTILSSIWNLLLTAAEGITKIISGVIENLSFGVIKLPPLDLSPLKIGSDEAYNISKGLPTNMTNGMAFGMPMANQKASQIGTDLSNSVVNGISGGIPMIQSKSYELANAAQSGASNAVNSSNAQWSTLPQGVDAGFAQATISVQQGATNMYNGAKQSFSGLAEIGRQAGSDLYNGVGTSLNMLSANVKVAATNMYLGASISFRMLASTGRQEMSNLYNGATTSANMLAMNVRTACTNMYNGSKTSFTSLSTSAISTITLMCSTVTSKVSAMANSVTSKWNSIRSTVSRPITASFSVTTTQTTVKKAIDGGGNSKTTTKHATGGIFTTPHYALFAEEPGGEAVIPLNGKRRDRAISLWQETGEKLGLGTEKKNVGNQSSYFTTGNRSRFNPKESPDYDTGDDGSHKPSYGFEAYSPKVVVSGGSDVNVTVEVNNNFDSTIDEDYIVDETTRKVGIKLREAFRNRK